MMLTRGQRVWAFALGLGASLMFSACSKETNTIVEAGLDSEASPAAIDADPWALLPSGQVAWAYLDARQLFASRFGPSLVNIVARRTPALGDAGFEPKRDIVAVHVGVYSIQGADLVGVATGSFDVARIAAAVEKNPITPAGIELTKTRYGGRTLFMAEASGFCVLTQRTALFGNQMGMRRAIDRIRRGKLDRRLPPWLEKQLSATQAPVVMGMNLKENPLSEATRRDLPFLNGIETLGMIANFQDPGVNLAGTATYPDAQAAQQGAQSLKQLNDYLQSMGWLMSLLGIAQPLKSLVTEAADNEARFVAQIDGAAADRLIGQLDAFLPGGSQATAPAPVQTPLPSAPGASSNSPNAP